MRKKIKKALIFGVTGQDGSYLSEFLLSKDYSVVGVSRRVSTTNTQRIDHLLKHPRFSLAEGDITDPHSVNYIINTYKDSVEIYNLAAQSHVGVSFKQPSTTWDITGKGCLNILESIRLINPEIKFYQASSSEMFGDQYTLSRLTGKFQNEDTPFNPQSPYAIAKLAAHHATCLYKKSYGLHASCGILYNHESPRRGENFVTRKITKYIAKLVNSSESIESLKLGNLFASRDWGYAGDYVEAMWLMLQQDDPDVYVVATGETYSVEEFLLEAFSCVGIDDYSKHVEIDTSLIRPSEVPFLKGDYSKAEETFGWRPKTSFEDLVSIMVNYDIERVKIYDDINPKQRASL